MLRLLLHACDVCGRGHFSLACVALQQPANNGSMSRGEKENEREIDRQREIKAERKRDRDRQNQCACFDSSRMRGELVRPQNDLGMNGLDCLLFLLGKDIPTSSLEDVVYGLGTGIFGEDVYDLDVYHRMHTVDVVCAPDDHRVYKHVSVAWHVYTIGYRMQCI